MTAVTDVTATERSSRVRIHLPRLRAALLEQRRFRTEQLEELSAWDAAGSALTGNDPRDEVTDTLRAGATSALSEIDAALERIETGRYGSCEVCERPLPLARLNILPTAALCMPCQHAREARAR
jgi:DnaK suppressor protein